jgi:hypothetical protein
MGASRELQNIFLMIKYKEYHRAWHFIKNFNKTTYEDTFMPYVCKIKGHKPYQTDKENEPNEWACKRCHRYIKYNSRKEKLKKLNKING